MWNLGPEKTGRGGRRGAGSRSEKWQMKEEEEEDRIWS